MAKQTTPFKLMIAEETIENEPKPDRGGGQTHGLFRKSITKVAEKTVDPKKMKENFESCLEQTRDLLENAEKKISQGWEIESINLSFAINGEGSIGLVTVGVEAGIEITLIPKGRVKSK